MLLLWNKVHRDDLYAALLLAVIAPFSLLWLLVTCVRDRMWEMPFVTTAITIFAMVVLSSLGVTFDVWQVLGIWLISGIGAGMCVLISQSGNIYTSERQLKMMSFIKEAGGVISMCIWLFASVIFYYALLRWGYLGLFIPR